MKSFFVFSAACLLSFADDNLKAPTSSVYQKDERFDEIFKPLEIGYLYDLFDKHPGDHSRLSKYFEVKKIIGNKKKTKLVAYSLFWKPQDIVNESTIHEVKTWKDKKCSFYDKYVKPIIHAIRYYDENETETCVRIYLASDLEFLSRDFFWPNVEIYVMGSSSIGHSPGAMWRFLAFNDKDAEAICIHDADDKIDIESETKINQWIKDKSTHGFYRVCSFRLTENLEEANYSPIQAGLFGAKKVNDIDFEKAMKGFILHRELYSNELRHKRDVASEGHPCGFGNQMPAYGFDERFLKHAVYFYAAKKGILTTISLKKKHVSSYYELKNQPQEYLRVKDYKYVLERNEKAVYN